MKNTPLDFDQKPKGRIEPGPETGGVAGKALFLDRDGTLIVHRPYLSDPAGVELLTGVREALHGFLAEGYRLFLFTNQSGIGRGLFDRAAVDRCNARMMEHLRLPAPGFTEICIAPETPEMPQVYRKPSPRFINEMVAKYVLAASATWMVGDSLSDVRAGLNAGVQAALISGDADATVPAGVRIHENLLAFFTSLHVKPEGR